jgi:simple sugar transport system ATP-binding protein
MPPAVNMVGISRRFGDVQALDQVDFSLEKGEIHALVGENGAGKTTLMRILYGSERPDAGVIELGGDAFRLLSAADGIAAGIGMVSQHYSIIPELSCLDNLMLGAEPSWLLKKGEAKSRAASLAAQMNFAFDWDQQAEHLTPSGSQKLEILKLLWRRARIMILDEPTAMLSPSDSDALFASLKHLAKSGATVIVVTHRIPEVLENCDRVTVLRGGKLVESRPVMGSTATQLAELIIGQAVDLTPRLASTEFGSITLTCENLTVKGYRGDHAVKEASISVRSGEMLGVAGVDGSGQRELFWSLIGRLKPLTGSIEHFGTDISRASVASRLKIGFRLIPEDRHSEGVVDEWSLVENAAIGLQRQPLLCSGPWIAQLNLRKLADAMAVRFDTRHGGLAKPISGLSGGNQQRFVAARALALEPKVILAFQPARGLDIEATRQVYEAIAQECKKGACAVVVSFDLDELLDNCGRVVAMNRGKILEAPKGLERDRKTIGELMVASE